MGDRRAKIESVLGRPVAGTVGWWGRSMAMQAEDDIPEFASTQIAVEETNRLFRLTPTAVDLSKAGRQIALVPANLGDDARRIATISDPMGRDSRDVSLFTADSMATPERHVVGDVIFRSTPNPAAATKRKA